jgi:hypothetical protein
LSNYTLAFPNDYIKKVSSLNRVIKLPTLKLAKEGGQPLRLQNAEQDIRFILFSFSEVLSRALLAES